MSAKCIQPGTAILAHRLFLKEWKSSFVNDVRLDKGKMLAKYRTICYDNSVPQLEDGVFFKKDGRI